MEISRWKLSVGKSAALMNDGAKKSRIGVGCGSLSQSVRVISEHWYALTFRQGWVTNTLAGRLVDALTRQLAAV